MGACWHSLDLDQHCLSRQTELENPGRLHWSHRGAVSRPPPDGSSAREGRRDGEVWVANGSVDGNCKGWRRISSAEEVSGGMKGLHLFQLDLGCAGGKKKGHRALSEKSSSLSTVQAEDAQKQGGEEVAMKLDTCRGPSRSPAEGGITAGPGCNSAEILVPAKMFLGNKLFSTAREGERTLGRGSADGASGIWDAEVSRRENNSSRQRI